MIGCAYEIKQSVTMAQVCDMYGLEVKRGSFICCPFHSGDRTASLKIYGGDRGFHCFGCGAGGSVIDFVMLLFGISFFDAVRMINDDFHLGLDLDGEPDEQKRREAEERARQRLEAQRRKQEAVKRALAAYNLALSIYTYLDVKRIRNEPKGPQEPISEEYLCAVTRLPVAEYELSQAEMQLYEIGKQRG